MRTIGYRLGALGLGVVLAQGCAYDTARGTASVERSEAHAHIGHVASRWTDTPGQQGLLPTLEAEAKVAAQHAGFAVQKLDDLDWMKTHTRHVRHAIDASTEKSGPGLGYGAIRAARGVILHINLAARSKDASKNVKLHAKHVATSASNVVSWGNDIILLSDNVLATKKAKRAANWVRAIHKLTQQIQNGVDADGDGKITWVQREGGIVEINKHLGFMKKGEGLK